MSCYLMFNSRLNQNSIARLKPVSHDVIVIVAICNLLSVKTHSRDFLNEEPRWLIAQLKQELELLW